MAAACLDAHEATGNIVYEMMAEELAHYAVRTMWDEAARRLLRSRGRRGGRSAIGLHAQPLKPFVANCDAARALLDRLAAGDRRTTTSRHWPTRALAAMAPLAPARRAAGRALPAGRRRAVRAAPVIHFDLS